MASREIHQQGYHGEFPSIPSPQEDTTEQVGEGEITGDLETTQILQEVTTANVQTVEMAKLTENATKQLPGDEVQQLDNPASVVQKDMVVVGSRVDIHSGITEIAGCTPEVTTSEKKPLEITDDDDDIALEAIAGTFRFDVGDLVTDYNSDEAFCCLSDDDDDDDDAADAETGDQMHSGVRAINGYSDPERDGREVADGSPGEHQEVDADEVDAEAPFPWRDAGVVDLEAASQWDFTILTRSCKPVAKELIERSISFIQRLRRVEDFKTRMREEKVIDADQIDAIFHNLEEVLKLQCIVLAEFKEELRKSPLRPLVGKVLQHNAPFLRLHEQLTCHNHSGRQAIEQLSQRNLTFRAALANFQMSGDRMGLGDLLLEPYKYVIDLRSQLSRYIKESRGQEDQQNAEDALSTIKSVLTSIDKKSMVYHKSNNRMLELRPHFKKKKIEIMKAHRTLQMEGKMSVISPHNGQPNRCEVFLFNDILVLCVPYLAESLMSSVRVIAMHKTIVVQEDSRNIIVYSPDNVIELHVSCSNAENWLKTLTDVAEPPLYYEIRDKVVYVDTPLGSRAPRYHSTYRVWKCSLCQTAFMRGLKVVYYCQACGCIICATCSSRKMPLPYRRDVACRVCDRCWRHLQVQSTN